MMPRDNTPTKKRRRSRASHQTERQLKALEVTPDNAAQVQQIRQGLLLWSARMFEVSPTFAGTLYAALCDEWLTRMRGVLYEAKGLGDDNDERDRLMVQLNTVVLDALWEATGRVVDRSPREINDRAVMLQSCADLFHQLAESASENLTGIIPPALDGETDRSTSDLAERIADLQTKLDTLERLPENEGERFKLKTKIHQLEYGSISDEWPDVIGGEA